MRVSAAFAATDDFRGMVTVNDTFPRLTSADTIARRLYEKTIAMYEDTQPLMPIDLKKLKVVYVRNGSDIARNDDTTE